MTTRHAATQPPPTSHYQERRIKVNQIYYDYKPKNAPPNAVTPPVPWISIKGKWLAKAGFTIDTPIKIKVSEGCLVLTVE